MILLRMSILYLLSSISFFALKREELKDWNSFDVLYLIGIIFLFNFYFFEQYSFEILLLLFLGFFLCRLLLEEGKDLKRLFSDEPVVIIENGVLNFRELKKKSYSMKKLLLDLRKIGVQSTDEIEYAILKGNKLLCTKK